MTSTIEQPSFNAQLKKDGYLNVPLRESGAGHMYATGKLCGRIIDVLVDTGASHTVIDRSLALELGLTLLPSAQAGAGIGDAQAAAELIGHVDMVLGDVRIPVEAYAMDLNNIRVALAARGVSAPSAVLGGDALRALDAVLLYRDGTLHLRPRDVG